MEEPMESESFEEMAEESDEGERPMLHEATTTVYKKPRISIQVLSDQLLEYVFSFLTFTQRTRCERVCKRWNTVSVSSPNLRLCGGSPNQWRNLDDGVLNLVLKRRGPFCKKFVLDCNTKLTCKSMSKIGSYCPNLESLNLGCKTRDQTDCLKTMAPSCPNLKSLQMRNRGASTVECTKSCNEGMYAVAQHCKSLEHVHIWNVQYVSPEWLDIINPYLRTFDLRVSSITSEAMRCIMRRCHTIQEMKLDYCNVSDQTALVQFLKYFRLTIRDLRISNLYYVPNVQWADVVTALPNLEILELYRCGQVNDEVLDVLSKKCPKLRYLDICSTTTISDVGFKSLQDLPRLSQLKINADVAGRGFESLLAKRILRQVFIVGKSPGVEEMCRNFKTKFPRVRFVPEAIKGEIGTGSGE